MDLLFVFVAIDCTRVLGDGINEAIRTYGPCGKAGNCGWTCIFPFKYKGITYNTCTLHDNLVADTPWCATTSLNSQGSFTGDMGNCQKGCEQPIGKYSYVGM